MSAIKRDLTRIRHNTKIVATLGPGSNNVDLLRDMISIGGVHVEHPLGLAGHSDADVLAHAITDALLGAAGLGDIGHHFPDTDPAFKGADSMVLLKEAMAAVRARGWRLGNIDATIIAQQPKMKPWLPGMITALSAA